MAQIKNYKKAITELQDILDKLKSNEIEIDQLAEKVKRANALLEYCKEVLYNTEQEINGDK